MDARRKKWLVMFAIALVLFTALVIAYMYIPQVEDAVDAVGIRARNVSDRLNPILKARADVVGEILGRVVPGNIAYRAEFIGCCMAMWRNESGFDPTIFNYYDDNHKLRVGHYPDNENWKRAHAIGIAQHVYLKERGLTYESAFDAETNIQASLRYLNIPAWNKIVAAVPDADIQTKGALLYMGHGRGPATVSLAAATIASGGSWSDVASTIEAEYGTGGLSFSNMWAHAANAQMYADAYGA